MTTVAEIRAYLNTLAPEQTAESWDHVGLLLGDPKKVVRKVLVALDPFENVAREAVAEGADLLLTHHPLIFEPLSAITTDTSVGRTILLLAAHGIAAVNAHTNLDVAPEGVNSRLAQILGLEQIALLNPQGVDSQGRQWGLLRMGQVEPQPLEQFLGKVRSTLGCSGLRYVDAGKSVCKVAVGGGSCGFALEQVRAAGCDTFVTADIKYNGFRDAYDLGLNLIDAGHFHTENPVCGLLVEKLAARFPDVTVLAAKNHKDVTNFF